MDSAALWYLKTMKMSRGVYWRWLMELESYQFTVVHRVEKLIPHVESLSRSSHLPPPEDHVQHMSEAGDYIGAIEEEDLN